MIVGIIVVVFVFLIILIVVYVFLTKPMGIEINPFESESQINEVEDGQSGTSSAIYDHPLLNEEQEKTLESIGVNLETVPTAISPEQEA